MPNKRGRQWTWQNWENVVSSVWRGNYATASLLAGMIFFALLTLAIVMREVAPHPPELEESPLLYAKREAVKVALSAHYIPECEEAALSKIVEPFRAFARGTGFYAASAFASSHECLDQMLRSLGLQSIEKQLRGDEQTSILFDFNCGVDLRESEPCLSAFVFAKNRGERLGLLIAKTLSEKEAGLVR
jgi:hypothetical protein